MEAANKPVFGKVSYDRAAESMFLDKLPEEKPDLLARFEPASPEMNLDVRMSQRDFDQERLRYRSGSEAGEHGGADGDGEDTTKFKVE